MKLLDTNRFYLTGTNNRFLHLATVQHGVREFTCMVDLQTSKVYIEEMTTGHPEFIQDDGLAQALSDFLTLKGALDITKPLLSDKQWYKKPQKP
jgi:hypothetical protein